MPINVSQILLMKFTPTRVCGSVIKADNNLHTAFEDFVTGSIGSRGIGVGLAGHRGISWRRLHVESRRSWKQAEGRNPVYLRKQRSREAKAFEESQM
jgi:hypothetical protein